MYDESRGLLAVTNSLCEAKRETLREALTRRRISLEKQLESVNDALAVIDKNPEFEKFHDAVSKAGY